MTSKRAGYSLFEVLIAFTILSLVLTALIPGQAKLLSRAAQSDQSALAMDYAMSVAAEIGVLTPLQIGSSQTPYRNWQVLRTVEQVSRTDTGSRVSIAIEVFDPDGRKLARLDSIGFIPDE